MKLLVGNLPWGTTDIDLENLFADIGIITLAQIAHDRDTGRSRGFGFVEVEPEEGLRAIEKLNGHRIGAIELRVCESADKPDRQVIPGRF